MISKRTETSKIEWLLLIYWVILVAWQNLSGAMARTGFDTVLKIALLFSFCVFFLVKRENVSNFNVGFIIISIFALSLAITFVLYEELSLSAILSYFYPVLFLMCVYLLGGEFTINKKQLMFILNGVILVVLYMVVYALIFKTSQFANALSLRSAYGSELSSFLLSSHEYGLYLSIATISAIICYELKGACPLSQKWYYVAVIPLFLLNILLTFSRTSMLGIGIALVIYCIFGKKSILKRLIIICGVIALLIVINVDMFRDFFIRIVFKEGELAGRDELAVLAIEKFENASLSQKLFGFGDTAFRAYAQRIAKHSSIHNAYLQILLSYGLIPLLFLAIYLIYDVFYCIRLCKHNKFIGILFLAIVLFGTAIMFTNTTMLFMSPIDSYFLTVFVVMLPKYVGNAIIKKSFD